MKKIILYLSIVIWLFGFDYALKPVKITEGVYQFLGVNEPIKKSNGGAIANTYWIKTKNYWIVFDSGPSYEYAKQAHSIMKKIANLPIKLVFNSHFHDDHWLGDCYYKQLNIPIYATKAQAQEFVVGGSSRVLNIVADLIPKTKIVSVDKIVDNDFSIKIDGEEFKFIKINSAHSPQDYILYLPQRKVLFTGDLIMSERITSVRHGSVENNLKAIRKIKKINPEILATGHGKYTDKTAIIQTKNYLLKLKNSALKAIEEEIELDDFVKNNDFNEFKHFKLYDVAHKENLITAFREYEFF